MTAILGRPAKLKDCAGHFEAFVHYLIDRTRTAFNKPVSFAWAEGYGASFEEIMQAPNPILMGTFHVGYSDLMGFFMRVFNKKIHMLRLRLGNSEDTDRLESLAGEFLKIIWVNQPQETIYALKEVISQGGSVAMQCDRVQHSSKLDTFHFLGAKRYFPVSIYSLSILFQAPVIFIIAGGKAGKDGKIPVYDSAIFRPEHASKQVNLQSAQEHFQSVLNLLEGLLRSHPQIWFNFEPLNPIEKT